MCDPAAKEKATVKTKTVKEDRSPVLREKQYFLLQERKVPSCVCHKIFM